MLIHYNFPFSQLLLLLYILHLHMLQTQQYIAIITLYNFMPFKRAEKRKNKYVFTMFVIFGFLFAISGSCHLSCEFIIWRHFRSPVQLCSHLLSLCCYCQIHFISIYHRPHNSYIRTLKSVMRRRNIHLYCFYIIIFTGALCKCACGFEILS